MKTCYIYTDASNYEQLEVGSWAIVVYTSEKVEKYSGIKKNATNNKLELKAINEALTFIRKNKINKAIIFSDSSYCINNILNKTYEKWKENKWKTTKKNKIKNADEWKIFDKNINVLHNIDISFMKVKAHSNNSFNNLADKIAKEEIKKYLQNK